jgi:hypothetical protein
MESTLEHVQHGLVLDRSSSSQMETLPGLPASLDFLPSYHQTSSQNPRRTCFRRFRWEVKLERCKSLNLGYDTQERKQITGILFSRQNQLHKPYNLPELYILQNLSIAESHTRTHTNI